MSEKRHLSEFKVTKKAMRPASDEEQCFYCSQLIGDCHLADCVLVRKKVQVTAHITYTVDVPNEWSEEMINFHFNESTWCSDNAFQDIEHFIENDCDDCCSCPHIKIEYIQTIEGSFRDED